MTQQFQNPNPKFQYKKPKPKPEFTYKAPKPESSPKPKVDIRPQEKNPEKYLLTIQSTQLQFILLIFQSRI